MTHRIELAMGQIGAPCFLVLWPRGVVDKPSSTGLAGFIVVVTHGLFKPVGKQLVAASLWWVRLDCSYGSG